MGKLGNLVPHEGRVPLVDGNLSAVVDLSDDTTAVHVGAGRLLGYIINVALSAHVVSIEDTGTELFSLPVSKAVSDYIPVGGENGLEFLVGLTITPNASSTGSVTFVYQPYPESTDE